MRFVLFQPDMPGNFGAAMRLCACFGLALEVIEPCGFPLTAKALRRAAMDYAHGQEVIRHKSFESFTESIGSARLVLMTTKGSAPLQDFAFKSDDILLFGRESAGVPDHVHSKCDGRVIIPMASGARSLNLVNAASITLFEALRQTRGFPELAQKGTGVA